MTKNKVDFNSDVGESFGQYKLGLDEEIVRHVSSVNIACGFHAGDPTWMNKTVKLAEKNGVRIGAHPAYPDLQGFGRRNMKIEPEEVKNDIIYQIGALTGFTTDKKIQHVKPHGAMYNNAVNDEKLAEAICNAIIEVDSTLILLALSGSRWISIAKELGLKVAQEVFADRAINSDGTLVSRSLKGAVIHDPDVIAERTVKMIKQGYITSITGEDIEVEADSICMHGDNPSAVQIAEEVKLALKSAGIKIAPLSELV
ncbi:MAG: lactam utilization protein LamB [Dehalococcoidia bacterium]|nr:lactam utilization protein LamB [Dehalococcoidia bacterium]MQG15788.1 LamB/YcsF family protein [SAR202 cluster bacterium]|tara:strand:+ start:155 stop:922 length:768 start_codon:yes stop_codon:yes gene_type:complete